MIYAKSIKIKTCKGPNMKFFMLMIFSMSSSLVLGQDLPLNTAKKIAEKAMDYAGKRSWKISIAIVNKEGNLVLFERGDGSYSGSIDSSIQKATSSNAFQRPTSAFIEAVKTKPGLISGKNIIAIEGGVPILLNGKHVGAIGISGAKAVDDEEIALESLKFLTAR